MSKFMELYEIADNITNIYDEISVLTNRKIISPNSNDYNKLVEEAKILVLKESAILSSLEIEELGDVINDLRRIIQDNFNLSLEDDITTVEGIEVFLKKLSNNREECKYDVDVLLRIYDRLKNQTYILCGEAIRVKIKINDNQVTSYDVSLWDSIMSFLNIQTLKNIKDKIFGLVPSNRSDIKFIDKLKFEFECSKLTYFYATFMSEIFALHAFNDVDKMIVPEIGKLKKLDIFDNDLYNEFLLNEAKLIALDLASLEYLENNPECIFYFLRLVTSFEVLIINMNKKTLNRIAEYCITLTNDNNLPCMEGINKFVKQRIKKER